MKNSILVIFMLFFTIGFYGCAEADNMDSKSSPYLIKMTFNGNEIIVRLLDTALSKEFISTLPLSLSFDDYVGKEKIASLPSKLKTPTSGGHKPEIGDFTYYSPWGNLAVFYGANSYASGLILMGRIESGQEKLIQIDGNFKVLIEQVK